MAAMPVWRSVLLCDLGKDHAPQLGYLVARSLFEDDPQDVARDAELKFQTTVAEAASPAKSGKRDQTRWGSQLWCEEFIPAPPTHIYQVTAREDTSRAVYWWPSTISRPTADRSSV